MIAQPLPVARTARSTHGAAASTKAAAPDAATQAHERALAAQKLAFDTLVEERAELLREHDALEELLQAQLKNEDAIVKKWIAMV